MRKLTDQEVSNLAARKGINKKSVIEFISKLGIEFQDVPQAIEGFNSHISQKKLDHQTIKTIIDGIYFSGLGDIQKALEGRGIENPNLSLMLSGS